ncbi:MAG: hypothetical protein ABFS41_16725 [Myxococcota bacterium]
MSDGWIVKRRPRRDSPLRRHRFVETAVAAQHSALPFPGSMMPEPEGGRERVVSGSVSFLLHAGLVLALFLVAQLAPDELVEQIIEVQRLDEPSEEEPAPRPRAIAESRARFDPAPMALAPQIFNPTVIQKRVPNVQAQQVQVAQIAPVQAPVDIARPVAPQVDIARNFQAPVAASAAPVQIDTAAPSLGGPVEFQAPVGTLAGPRQVVTGGNTVGIGAPTALGTGSSVREGIASDRDVLGGKTGERASVNVAVGPGGGRGTGGTGTGPGGVSFDECMKRPEVQTYLARLKERVMSRWRSAPTALPNGVFKATLGFRLDPSGSASQVDLVSSENAGVGRSAADAMRAASPFDLMGPKVRCLAGNRFNATFTLENVAAN